MVIGPVYVRDYEIVKVTVSGGDTDPQPLIAVRVSVYVPGTQHEVIPVEGE